MKGTVTKLYGKACTVRPDTPLLEEYECYLRGRLFEDPKIQFAVGDRVEFDPVEEFHHRGALGDQDRLTGVIHEILPRRSSLYRPPKKREREPQLVAANIDQLVIVSSLKRPSYKTGLIDRYLIIADRSELPAVLCLNKIDLGQPQEIERARKTLRTYRDLGYPLILTSALTGEGCDELKDRLEERRSVLVGHSGVGKSKLAGKIQPGVSLASSEVRRSGKGRHTTTVSSLIQLDFGGELVDTPGIRELGIADMRRKELAQHFDEFEPYLGKCQFKSCSHIPEPGCAVKGALKDRKIRRARYESYERLYHELAAK